MSSSCNSCASTVCSIDPYCCNTEWDQTCIDQAEYYCNDVSCSGGSGGGSCHDVCQTGDALDASCGSCAATVCGIDDYCCSTSWDATCVDEAETYCGGVTCGGSGGGGNTCGHDECIPGGALTSSCSPCAQAVCAADDFCCNSTWDDVCVDLAYNEAACNYCF
jgi:hypothetical protein